MLEARSPGSPWIEFKVVRTDAHGRYRASYRFKFAGPANYRFRARSEAESDFPFAGGVVERRGRARALSARLASPARARARDRHP